MMRYRIKKDSLMEIIITFMIIVNLGLLKFEDYSQFFRYLTSGVSIALFFVCYVSKKIRKLIRPYTSFANKWIFTFMFLMLIEVMIGIANTETFIESAGKAHIFTWFLMFYPIIYIMASYKNGDITLIKNICFWTIVTYVLKTILWWLFNYRGIDLLHYILYEQDERGWVRNGLQRIPAPCFAGILFSVMLQRFLNEKSLKKVFPAVIICFQLFYAQFVFQSRTQLICFICVITSVIILIHGKAQYKVFAIWAIIIGGLVIGSSGILYDFMWGSSQKISSIENRLYAFARFIDLIKGHLLFGFQHIYKIDTIRGSLGISYVSDMGILSNFFYWGVIGFGITIIPFIRMLIVLMNKAIQKSKDFPLLLGLFLYTTMFSVPNNIYESVLLFAFPFIMALFEFKKVQYKITFSDI